MHERVRDSGVGKLYVDFVLLLMLMGQVSCVE